MKVLAVGHALTDTIAMMPDDGLLSELSLSKGGMSTATAAQFALLKERISRMETILSPGGSAANTARAMSMLGCRCDFAGRVGNDHVGDLFAESLRLCGCRAVLDRSPLYSGECVSLVSRDGERTMVSSHGAALDMRPEDFPDSLLREYDVLYLEGFVTVDPPLALHLTRRAMALGLETVVDLADRDFLGAHIGTMRQILDEGCGTIMANLDEAMAVTGMQWPSAAEALSGMCRTAVVKRGSDGAEILKDGEQIHIGITDSPKVDSTGAGDFFAAGFLSGMAEGMDLRSCGMLGAVTAGEAVAVKGTALDSGAWARILAGRRLIRDGRLQLRH